jgi:pimeloyl-ACP methyl ester carboxylesterase
MMKPRLPIKSIVISILGTLILVACSSPPKTSDLGGIYNQLAQHEDPYRNPIVLIPGMLGSKLIDPQSDELAWGTFGFKRLDPTTPEGARLISLPMQPGRPLGELQDDLKTAGTLDNVVVNFGGYPVVLNAYAYILGVLGVGGYRDQQLSESGDVDWGDRHFTCFQFDYDWRRDIVESAKNFDAFIKEKKRYVEQEIEKRFGIKNRAVKFDIVAHSMGGLVARYYIRYGTQDLPADGSLPELTWEGSRYIDKVIMVGTPNSGSIDALRILVNGYKPALFLPRYPPSVIGTMPAVYQMLPRSRHRILLNEQGQPVADILDPELWINNGWGLADPEQDDVLQMLLPQIAAPQKRREVAIDHLKKSLQHARQFMRAMDLPAEPPPSVRYYLVAGDSENTDKTVQLDHNGHLKSVETAPGDAVVLRSSALLDERRQENRTARLISPIKWNQVIFLFSDHRNITKDPEFTDNLLYILLESP